MSYIKRKEIYNQDGSVNIEYLKHISINQILYSGTLIARNQVSTHEEALIVFQESNLGTISETNKGYKLRWN
jgi:hypothetical protein